VPHALPFGALPPAVQTGRPVEHAIVASWHDAASAQSLPVAHGEHPPLWQTPASHAVPFALVPVGVHEPMPASQTVTPVTHVVGWHGVPEIHWPASPGCGPSDAL
jgi:hypothetical protein